MPEVTLQSVLDDVEDPSRPMTEEEAEAVLTLLESEGVDLRMNLCWTRAYHPFALGELWRLTGAWTETERPIFYKGIFLAEVHAPNNINRVIHFDSGGIVGSSLEEVKRDIDSADLEVMRKQLKDAMRMRESVIIESAEQFWKRSFG